MGSVVALNEVNQVPSRSVLTNNSQVVRCEEDLLELNDVGMVAAQPLIEDLPACRFDTACIPAPSSDNLCFKQMLLVHHTVG